MPRAADHFGNLRHFVVPLLQQPRTLGRRAVLSKVVVDQFDVAELGRLRRDRSLLVRRHLEALHAAADGLRFGRQRPVVPLARVGQVLGALDDAHRADLVAGAFAGRDDLHRRAAHRLRHRVVLEGDADQALAGGRSARRRGAALGVLVDVLVHRLHQVEGFLFTQQLHQRRQHRVRGARRIRVGHLHVVLVDRLGQIGPALRLGQLALGQLRGVEAVAERAGVDADGAELGCLGLTHRPVLQVVELRRNVGVGQRLFGRLQVRVAGAAPPHIALRVCGLGLDLCVELARALARHQHLDAGGFFERGGHRPAPLFLHAAIEQQLTLALRERGRAGGSEQGGEQCAAYNKGLHRFVSYGVMTKGCQPALPAVRRVRRWRPGSGCRRANRRRKRSR